MTQRVVAMSGVGSLEFEYEGSLTMSNRAMCVFRRECIFHET